MTFYPAGAGSEEELTNFESPSIGNFIKNNTPLRRLRESGKQCKECGSNRECDCNKNKGNLNINLPAKKNKDIKMDKPKIRLMDSKEAGSSLKCPNCGASNPIGRKVCMECNKELGMKEAGVQGMKWGIKGQAGSDTHTVARKAGFEAHSANDDAVIYNHPSGAMLKVQSDGSWTHRSTNGVKSTGESPKQLGDHIKQHPVQPAVESRRQKFLAEGGPGSGPQAKLQKLINKHTSLANNAPNEKVQAHHDKIASRLTSKLKGFAAPVGPAAKQRAGIESRRSL